VAVAVVVSPTRGPHTSEVLVLEVSGLTAPWLLAGLQGVAQHLLRLMDLALAAVAAAAR